MEAAECGAASLGAVLAHLGRWVPIEELRTACCVGRDGSSAADIVAAGDQFGLAVTGWRKEVAELRDEQLPVILFWEFNHFLVLEGFGRRRRGGFYLNDPANGRRFVGDDDFDAAFTGIVLRAEPTPEFRPGGEPPGILRKLRPWLRGARGSLAYVVLAGLLLAVPALALPVLLAVFIDNVLSGTERSWGSLLVAGTAAAGVFTYLVNWLKQFTLRKLTVQLSVVNAERMLWRLFRLPSQYFAHRFAGDLTSRVQLIDSVAYNSSQYFVAIIVELVMSALLFGLMLFFDATLALIVAAIGLANVGAMRLLSGLRTDDNRQLRREQALLAGISAAGLRNIDSLRATAGEDDFFVRWSGHQARELTARQKFSELGYVIGALPGLFLLLGGMAVLGFGGRRVISGDMTIGAFMGFYILAGHFLIPVGRFVQLADVFQILEADLQRIDDVLDAPEDPALKADHGTVPTRAATLNGRLRLAGRIELRDVTFGYQRNRPPLIEGFNLTVQPGQRIAVIGPTGSGKSTLLRLISGEYTPSSGEILFDGVPAREIPRNVLTGSVAVVDQQIFLFAASVRDNLTMWNPTVGDQQIVNAAKDALIHDEIMNRALGYDSPVKEGGRNFSGGQRQRLEIARAPRQQPLRAVPRRSQQHPRRGDRGAHRRRPAPSWLHLPHRRPPPQHHPRLRPDHRSRPRTRGSARHPHRIDRRRRRTLRPALGGALSHGRTRPGLRCCPGPRPRGLHPRRAGRRRRQPTHPSRRPRGRLVCRARRRRRLPRGARRRRGRLQLQTPASGW